MNRFLSFALASLVLLLNSCSGEMTPEEIYENQSSGVVLVLNQFYYSVTLNDGSKIYFSGQKDGELENVAFEEDSIKSSMAFGTAFFIDKNGSMLTNRHVVEPVIEKKEVSKYIRNLIDFLQEYAREKQQEIAYQYQVIQQQIQDNTGVDYDENIGWYHIDSPENEYLRQQLQYLEEQFNEAEYYINGLKYIDPYKITIDLHSKIGIAYNNSHVSSPNDFKSCLVTKKSDDADLAVIRLRSGATPANAFVFSTPKDDKSFFEPELKERETLKLNQPLILIGYNRGIELANTKEGVKVQLTTGNVSQQPDDDHVMYTIPLLQGSSGSPVLNSYGEVVAINFAGMNGTQSFNFGIPLKQIKKFLNIL